MSMYRINIREADFLLNFPVETQFFIFLLNSRPAARKIAAL